MYLAMLSLVHVFGWGGGLGGGDFAWLLKMRIAYLACDQGMQI